MGGPSHAAQRLFVAVSPDARFRASLSHAVDPWRSRIPVRWTSSDQWHLTLQFLGDWPRGRVSSLETGLAEAAAARAFTLPAQGLGGFPNLRRPRVLFLQLEDGGAAADLARSVRDKVAGIWPDGPQDTKPFRAHLTLARIRAPLPHESINLLGDMDFTEIPDLPVTGFTLFSSVLGRQGARHTPVATYGLRK